MLRTREEPIALISRCEAILRKRPPDADVLVQLGHAFALIGRFEDALSIYEIVNQSAPRNAEAYLGRAHALESMTRFQDAYTEYQKALRISPSDDRARTAADALATYLEQLAKGLPYLGRVMDSDQNPANERAPFMRQLIKDECHRQGRESFVVLEVGSWAGGSALKWAHGVAEHNGRRGRVFCVDGWRPYHDDRARPDYGYSRMNWACRTGEIYRLFLHNVRAAGFEDIIHPLKASSDEMLPLLHGGQFHFVYIDGSHLYDDALYDTGEAIRLVADGGVVAGDDLELQLHECDRGMVESTLELELALDPSRNASFHPGVTKVVAEKFGKVLSYNGLWAVRRVGGGWEPVEITPDKDAADGY